MLLAGPMKAAAACREGAAAIRRGPELDPSYADELEAIADRLDEVRARMTADLDALPRPELPEWEEDDGSVVFEDEIRRPLIARGAVLTT